MIPSQQEKPAPTLAVWTVIPLIAFLIVQAIWDWPKALAYSPNLQNQIPYFAGRVLGAVLFAVLIAWILYRICGRSQTVGSITFSVALAFFALSSVLPALKRTTIVKPALPMPAVASFDEFQFEIPAGWSKVAPDRKTTAAMIVRGNTASGGDALLKVDAGVSAVPNPRKVAESFAGTDGQISPAPVSLDGIDGIRVDTPSRDLSRPRHILIVFRDGKMYLLFAAAKGSGADISADFNSVIKSWRWNSKN